MTKTTPPATADDGMISVRWYLALGTSALITRTAEVLGCVANRHGVLADALAVGLDNYTMEQVLSSRSQSTVNGGESHAFH